MDKKKKRPYEKPAYEVEGIFEKMSLKCHTNPVACKLARKRRRCRSPVLAPS